MSSATTAARREFEAQAFTVVESKAYVSLSTDLTSTVFQHVIRRAASLCSLVIARRLRGCPSFDIMEV